jgi:uncharacterized protein YlaN (UPF0358 family)
MMGIFRDMNQDRQIRDMQGKASEAHSLAKDASERIEELQGRVEHLKLVCAAMWELLRDTGKLTEQDLAVRIADIDSRDGKIDGTLGSQVPACANCKKPLMRSQDRCIYCGEPAPKGSVFESL